MSIIFAEIINQNGTLSLNLGTGAPVDPVESQGLLLDDLGQIYATDTVPPTKYAYGLPFDDNGRLVLEDDTIAYYSQGLPFTANNALAAANDEAVGGFYNQGLRFNDSGTLAVTGLTPPPPSPPTVWGPLLRYLNNAAFTGVEVRKIAADGNGVWVALGSGAGAASRSIDDGANWTALPSGLNSGSATAAWRSIGTDMDGVWVAGAQSGYVARSADNGATWAAVTRGLNTGVNPTWQAIKTDKAGVWVAVALAGYASRSIDNGLTWTGLTQGLNSGNPTGNLNGLATDGQGNWIAGGASTTTCARSTDNGATWTALNISSSPTDNIQSIVADEDGNFIAFGGTGYAWRSVDAGASWTLITPQGLNSGSITLSMNGSAIDPFGSVVVGGSGGYAAYSVDTGATFSVLTRGLNSGSTVETLQQRYLDGGIPEGFHCQITTTIIYESVKEYIMPNQPTSFIDATSVTAREAEVPLAAFDNGMNLGGSNAPGLGIATAGEIQTQDLDESLPNWTLLDQDEDAREPQVSQHIGGDGLDDGVAGKGTVAIDVNVNDAAGDGSATIDGVATLADLSVGWTSV